MTATEFSHEVFTVGLVVSTLHAIVWGSKIIMHIATLCFRARTNQPADLVAPPKLPSVRSQTMTEKPVCWKVMIALENTVQGKTVASVTSASRRGVVQCQWSSVDQTPLEALEQGILNVFPHFKGGDRVVVLCPAEAQIAFDGKSEEPHDNIVAERIETILKRHNGTFKVVTNQKSSTRAPAGMEQALAQVRSVITQPQPKVPQTGESLPPSSAVFDETLGEAASF